MSLTRERIKARKSSLPREPLHVPELGDEPLYVSKMTAASRDKFEAMVNQGVVGRVNLENIRARFCTLVCVNDKGEKLFTDEDSEWLGEFDTDVIQKIFDVGARLNGISASAVEDAAKN